MYNKGWQPTVYTWTRALTLTHTPNVTQDPILNNPNKFTYGQNRHSNLPNTYMFYNILGENTYSLYMV